MSEAPRHVTELAERRVKARAVRDYAAADVLRQEIEQAGWQVRDSADGYELTVKPPFEQWPSVRSVPVSAMTETEKKKGGGLDKINPAAELGFSGDPAQTGDPGDDMLHAQRTWDASLATNRLDTAGVDLERQRVEISGVTASVGVIVDGWADDMRRCLESILEHTSAPILALDLGNVHGAGEALHELAERHPERITAWHVAEQPHWQGGTAGWGAARTKLMQLDTADVHVLLETSTVLEGDALTPLVKAVKDGAVAAGWKGVDPGENDTEWNESGPGRVRALLGYLMAVRRGAALRAFPEKVRYYRNADLVLSLALEGPLVVPDERLPVRQERHHGYHDVSPEYREREARRNYEAVLRMLRSS
ncbi:glycosyltransferase family 2 protein [Nonomuraea dietziae]|uniref:glycosyltransferase family 2 protein n=1 Tax=Nonomuraea dietziae TaxID=65515 RepID=UPI0033CD901A